MQILIINKERVLESGSHNLGAPSGSCEEGGGGGGGGYAGNVISYLDFDKSSVFQTITPKKCQHIFSIFADMNFLGCKNTKQ